MAGAVAAFISRISPDRVCHDSRRRGARLSVGQKPTNRDPRTRLLRRPEIMVLDEPTAPLESGSESD